MILVVNRPIECDVLMAGGDIGGLMATISAAGKGANVIIAEKAHTKRSGSDVTGNIYFMCYIPEKHGDDIEPILAKLVDSQIGGFHDILLSCRFLENSFDRVKGWND